MRTLLLFILLPAAYAGCTKTIVASCPNTTVAATCSSKATGSDNPKVCMIENGQCQAGPACHQ